MRTVPPFFRGTPAECRVVHPSPARESVFDHSLRTQSHAESSSALFRESAAQRNRARWTRRRSSSGWSAFEDVRICRVVSVSSLLGDRCPRPCHTYASLTTLAGDRVEQKDDAISVFTLGPVFFRAPRSPFFDYLRTRQPVICRSAKMNNPRHCSSRVSQVKQRSAEAEGTPAAIRAQVRGGLLCVCFD